MQTIQRPKQKDEKIKKSTQIRTRKKLKGLMCTHCLYGGNEINQKSSFLNRIQNYLQDM